MRILNDYKDGEFYVSGTIIAHIKIMHMTWNNISKDGEWFNKWESTTDLVRRPRRSRTQIGSKSETTFLTCGFSLGLSHRSSQGISLYRNITQFRFNKL